nr:integrase, catalytic region, zinc finger, CCHC-type, peptidase aspartic, catalytic [Tanacetum cinerariifolium]
MYNLTDINKAPVYDIDGSTEVQLNDNCYDNDIFNMFTQEEQYTDLLEPIPEPQIVPQNDNHVTSVASSMVQSGGTVETSSAPNEETRAHQETVYQKSTISSLMEEKKRLKHDLKTREDKYLDKEVNVEAKIKDLKNILLKRDQTVQTMHMLNPKPDSFYHPDQKMTLGYPNPLYIKKAQPKQQSLYNGNLLLEEHDPHTVYDLEETLELAQESREKMRFLKKEIKLANYAKINHLSGIFVPQMTKSKEELFLSNVSNMVTVSKTISIPNEDISDDTTPSVVRKFLNKVKNSLVTLQRIVKQNMTLEVVQICLWCVDSGCSKHMTRNIKLLINFVWKFLGTVYFGNDHIAAIMGYGDLKWGNITITRVYFVKGLGHNLFSIGQFCDANLEVPLGETLASLEIWMVLTCSKAIVL